MLCVQEVVTHFVYKIGNYFLGTQYIKEKEKKSYFLFKLYINILCYSS